ncbi:MAG: hypothetical protein R3E32_03610 [Chitinophagales bacterium]
MSQRTFHFLAFTLATVFFLGMTNSFAQNFGNDFTLTQSPQSSLSADYLQKKSQMSFGLDIEQQGIPTRKAQAIFFEVLGAGLTYSFNYDTRFNQTRDGLGIRAGISYIGDIEEGGIMTIPVQINHLMGKDNKYFELGIGATYATATGFLGDGDDNTVVGTMTFGYRLQPEDGGFLFRVSVTPVLVEGVFFPYFGGISFGYAF